MVQIYSGPLDSGSLSIRCYSYCMSAFCSATREYISARLRCHSSPETVCPAFSQVVWMICPFHGADYNLFVL